MKLSHHVLSKQDPTIVKVELKTLFTLQKELPKDLRKSS